jgi:hypothetical protein
MILIVREQLTRSDSVEMAARRPELAENDVGGYGMAFVEIDRGIDPVVQLALRDDGRS